MSNFIGLTAPDGERVMVNADHIITMQTQEATSFLAMSRGCLSVTESIYEIVEMTEPTIDYEL
jgi:uncharacterized protein YlzI (FlbEa/FlbD family)